MFRPTGPLLKTLSGKNAPSVFVIPRPSQEAIGHRGAAYFGVVDEEDRQRPTATATKMLAFVRRPDAEVAARALSTHWHQHGRVPATAAELRDLLADHASFDSDSDEEAESAFAAIGAALGDGPSSRPLAKAAAVGAAVGLAARLVAELAGELAPADLAAELAAELRARCGLGAEGKALVGLLVGGLVGYLVGLGAHGASSAVSDSVSGALSGALAGTAAPAAAAPSPPEGAPMVPLRCRAMRMSEAMRVAAQQRITLALVVHLEMLWTVDICCAPARSDLGSGGEADPGSPGSPGSEAYVPWLNRQLDAGAETAATGDGGGGGAGAADMLRAAALLARRMLGLAPE